jgi:hypothetical protein
VPIGNFFTSPGILSEKMYAYAAYDLELSGRRWRKARRSS